MDLILYPGGSQGSVLEHPPVPLIPNGPNQAIAPGRNGQTIPHWHMKHLLAIHHPLCRRNISFFMDIDTKPTYDIRITIFPDTFPNVSHVTLLSPLNSGQQITGNFSAVKKALLSVSSCLQDNPKADATNSAASKPSGALLRGTSMPAQVEPFPQRGYVSGLHAMDYHSRGYSSVPGPESIGASHRMVLEEEVVFRLLCQLDKVGSLIGKGGSIIRALQSDSGASIKIADAAPDSDERVVVISARENSEQKHSPAQDAVLRVHSRIAEIGFEPGAAVVARLLVHSQQIGCLLGKGGNIIAEMRRATGASIRIFAKEQVPKCGAQNDEVVQMLFTFTRLENWTDLDEFGTEFAPSFVQNRLPLVLSKSYLVEFNSAIWDLIGTLVLVIGSLQSVQDALFHITSRLRETIFPVKPPFPSANAPVYMSAAMEMPPPLFRSIHDPASPGHYPPPIGFSHGLDRSVPSQPMDRQPSFSHGMDRIGPANLDRVSYPYGSERLAHGSTFDRPSSPRSWTQTVSSGNPRGIGDIGTGIASRNGLIGSGSQASIVTSTTVEVVVPQTLLGNVYGENNSNLSQIMQISGAQVVVHDPRPGATEGLVVVSGTPDQTRAAQSLIQAFILCGQTTP
ncbi:hypothetical protein HHK36_026112 [Tetracentron sinense]|uniref:K Homology domain-containing protein n=1 Tax=Tetracentron sinense TaxID=13715 RepID=A0A835D683_TETSI|nr:hypothetical protein HHK36_026112 [Tetracentron sinense]